MVERDNNFRVNPDRAVYVTNEFTHDLVEKLLPVILELRKEKEPISVIINSDGGDVRCLNVLNGAMHSPCQDGFKWRIITCAIGNASSAGATLLALGDYAVAHSHSKIHFHGIRLSDAEITAEAANSYAEYLSQSNRDIARSVAVKMLDRLMHRYLRLKSEFPEIEKNAKGSPPSPSEVFAGCIEKRTSHAADKVVERALGRLRRLRKMISGLKIKTIDRTKDPLKQDTLVLKKLIDYEVAQYKNTGWRFNEGGINRLVADYLLIRDYAFGGRDKFYKQSMEVYAIEILSDSQRQEYEALVADSEEAKKYLYDNTLVIFDELWYFTLCLSRSLQQGENNLTAEDAYWLGLIDEVVGTDLHGSRKIAESLTVEV